MKMKFFMRAIFNGSLMLGSITPGFCINNKLLAEEAENLNYRIWGAQVISEEEIGKNLNFLFEEDNPIIKEYENKQVSFHLSKSYNNSIIPIENFKKFSESCKSIYDLFFEVDKLLCTSVKILFEKVEKEFIQQAEDKLNLINNIHEKRVSSSQLPDFYLGKNHPRSDLKSSSLPKIQRTY